jgi:hypothetical protein
VNVEASAESYHVCKLDIDDGLNPGVGLGVNVAVGVGVLVEV